MAAGTVQYVYAVHDIKKGDQLCVHYTSLFEPRRVRQQALLQEKFFTCACERCSTSIEQSVDRFLEVIVQCGNAAACTEKPECFIAVIHQGISCCLDVTTSTDPFLWYCILTKL